MPFLISFLAGCSTLIGYLFIYFKNKNNRVLINSLGFASGVMFFMSIYDLIPEGYKVINDSYYSIFAFLLCLLFIIIGIIISGYIDKYLPTHYDNSLYHVGLFSMLAIIIHNIPEGIATYLTSSFNIKLGITFGVALAFHNIPEGISISIPIYYSTGSKIKAFFYTLVSGMSELLGSFLAYFFLKDIIGNLFMGCLYSLIAGIMIYISIYELLPTSFSYHKNKNTILSFIIGMIFIYISIVLLK